MFNAQSAISEVVSANQHPEVLANTIYNLYSYIKENNWQGACHASCAALYVALTELGFSPRLCAGEVDAYDFIFDHSWLELDGKIIDVAVAFTLIDRQISNVVVFDVDIFTKEPPKTVYRTSRGIGLDVDASLATSIPFCVYMDNFPDAPNGLWSVVEYLLGHKIDIVTLRTKYHNTKWVK